MITRDHVCADVVAVVAHQVEATHSDPLPDVLLESVLGNDLGFDSLDVVETVMRCEERFGISIDDDDLHSGSTVSDLIGHVVSALRGKDAAAKRADYGSVLHDRVQEIVDLTRSVNDSDHDEKLITRLTAERAELIEALRPFVYDLPYFGIRSDMDDVCRARALLERLGAKEVG